MDLPGYDSWKLMSPDEERPRCEHCGAPDQASTAKGWQPDCCTGECGIKWRDPDAEYDAMRDDR
jgi:hypothetical protein